MPKYYYIYRTLEMCKSFKSFKMVKYEIFHLSSMSFKTLRRCAKSPIYEILAFVRTKK